MQKPIIFSIIILHNDPKSCPLRQWHCEVNNHFVVGLDICGCCLPTFLGYRVDRMLQVFYKKVKRVLKTAFCQKSTKTKHFRYTFYLCSLNDNWSYSWIRKGWKRRALGKMTQTSISSRIHDFRMFIIFSIVSFGQNLNKISWLGFYMRKALFYED